MKELRREGRGLYRLEREGTTGPKGSNGSSLTVTINLGHPFIGKSLCNRLEEHICDLNVLDRVSIDCVPTAYGPFPSSPRLTSIRHLYFRVRSLVTIFRDL